MYFGRERRLKKKSPMPRCVTGLSQTKHLRTHKYVYFVHYYINYVAITRLKDVRVLQDIKAANLPLVRYLNFLVRIICTIIARSL